MTRQDQGTASSIYALEHEERMALWSLRRLLGVSRNIKALRAFFGAEAERLQYDFRGFWLNAICGAAALEYSTTEAHLLTILADMQHGSSTTALPCSALEQALHHLGATLAAYGLWLPRRDGGKGVDVAREMPDFASEVVLTGQDNEDEFMEAAE